MIMPDCEFYDCNEYKDWCNKFDILDCKKCKYKNLKEKSMKDEITEAIELLKSRGYKVTPTQSYDEIIEEALKDCENPASISIDCDGNIHIGLPENVRKEIDRTNKIIQNIFHFYNRHRNDPEFTSQKFVVKDIDRLHDRLKEIINYFTGEQITTEIIQRINQLVIAECNCFMKNSAFYPGKEITFDTFKNEYRDIYYEDDRF